MSYGVQVLLLRFGFRAFQRTAWANIRGESEESGEGVMRNGRMYAQGKGLVFVLQELLMDCILIPNCTPMLEKPLGQESVDSLCYISPIIPV